MHKPLKISMIAAMDRNRVIGIGGKLPWHLPDDLKRFKELTMGKPLIMGRKTYESLGKPLPGRKHHVLSRTMSLYPELDGQEKYPPEVSIHRYHFTAEACISFESDEAFVIGGAEIYDMFYQMASTIYLTRVDTEIAGGDAFFPEFAMSQWSETLVANHPADERHKYPFSFTKLVRK